MERFQEDRGDVGGCLQSEDGTHCSCWWDNLGGAGQCCYCGDEQSPEPEVTLGEAS